MGGHSRVWAWEIPGSSESRCSSWPLPTSQPNPARLSGVTALVRPSSSPAASTGVRWGWEGDPTPAPVPLHSEDSLSETALRGQRGARSRQVLRTALTLGSGFLGSPGPRPPPPRWLPSLVCCPFSVQGGRVMTRGALVQARPWAKAGGCVEGLPWAPGSPSLPGLSQGLQCPGHPAPAGSQGSSQWGQRSAVTQGPRHLPQTSPCPWAPEASHSQHLVQAGQWARTGTPAQEPRWTLRLEKLLMRRRWFRLLAPASSPDSMSSSALL